MLITPLGEIVIPSPAVNLSYLFYKVLLIVARVLLIVSILKVLEKAFKINKKHLWKNDQGCINNVI